MELDSEDLEFNSWRKYATGGGRLYYDVFLEEPHIVKVHFAKTRLTGEDIPGLSRQCIHVLPLNWVNTFFSLSKMHAIMLFTLARSSLTLSQQLSSLVGAHVCPLSQNIFLVGLPATFLSTHSFFSSNLELPHSSSKAFKKTNLVFFV
jgi:hypothetical protein